MELAEGGSLHALLKVRSVVLLLLTASEFFEGTDLEDDFIFPRLKARNGKGLPEDTAWRYYIQVRDGSRCHYCSIPFCSLLATLSAVNISLGVCHSFAFRGSDCREMHGYLSEQIHGPIDACMSTWVVGSRLGRRMRARCEHEWL